MMSAPYPRSAKIRLGNIAHLGRMIDKVRLRQAGQIPDYNYLTVGFDRYLLDFLELDTPAFEQKVQDGGTDQDILDWVQAQMTNRTQEELARWNQRIEASGPMDEAAKRRFQQRLEDVAKKRGVSVATLPHVTAWSDLIELDEDRL
ncbi:MAG: DUF5069 domain-containing protein [Nitrospiraceae bacterium]|nr:DUF5069 domain-containing protein [Nitrospiraceae bacterium]MDW7653765.1 DUF5069 domain-containing protein [Nitrospiraceae bacterium]